MTILLAASGAHARIYIPVDQPSDKKFPIAIPDLKGGGKGEEVADIIRNDMKLSGYFDVIDPSLYDDMASKDGQNITDIKF